MLAAFLRDFVDREVAEGYRGTRVERLRMLSGACSLSRSIATGSTFARRSGCRFLPSPRTAPALSMRPRSHWSGVPYRSPHRSGRGRAAGAENVPGHRPAHWCLRAGARARSGSGRDKTIELADSGPRWLIRGEPGAKAKPDRFLPLSPLAVALFREALPSPGRRQAATCSAARRGSGPRRKESISTAWGTLRRAGKVPGDTRPHDLRRTRRTWWPELAHGQEEHILERILGHVVGTKVERTYDRALWLPQQRKVLDSVGQEAGDHRQGRRPGRADGQGCRACLNEPNIVGARHEPPHLSPVVVTVVEFHRMTMRLARS